MPSSERTLLIGYGNPYRSDDGVALHVMNDLRATSNRPALELEDDGEDDLGSAVDTLMQHQLLPELVPLLANYGKVIFIDAHTGVIPESVRVVPVTEEFGYQAVTHHMSPGMLLSLARTVNGAVPQAWLVSIKGESFDFGTELSHACAQAAAQAVEEIQRLIQEEAI